MFYPIFSGQENDIVSTTKVMIEIHVVAKLYYKKFQEENEKDYNISPLHYGKMSKLTVTPMNFQKAGFH